MKKNETKVICPKCGAEIAIAEHTHVAVGIAIGKDSGLGTVKLPLAKSAEERMKKMQNAGIDTSKFFSVANPSGEGVLMQWNDGVPEVVTDEIYAEIMNGKTIPNKDLFRRWILAQIFRMTANGKNFTESIHRLGYDYQWKMLEHELYVQTLLKHDKDDERLDERTLWYDISLVIAMLNDYVEQLHEYVDNRPVKKCKRMPYKTIGGKDIFITDIDKKVFRPVRDIVYKLSRYRDSFSLQELYETVCEFNRIRIRIKNAVQCKEWVNAYKGYGSYFAMQNLIRFHGCRVVAGAVTYSESKSLSKIWLEAKKHAFNNEGYKMYAMLKKMLEDNCIDIDAKRAEWRKRK